MPRPLHIFTVVCLATACARGALGDEAVLPNMAAATDAIESCVDTSMIRFRGEYRRALLDGPDSQAVRAAIASRYPKVEEDGLAPERVILWRHPQFGWVYVALLVNPSKPGEVCFTASFGADKFEMSTPLITKYFGSDI